MRFGGHGCALFNSGSSILLLGTGSAFGAGTGFATFALETATAAAAATATAAATVFTLATLIRRAAFARLHFLGAMLGGTFDRYA
ncbi:MAG TPA: hypothetical protein VH105_22265 [Burkholderiales bacterium]|nr:hypothetical protein [Burkholderiales bacterium]